MKNFLERLTGVVHWCGFLLSGLLIYLVFFSFEPSTNPFWLNFVLVMIPNMLGWLIKYIVTGNNKFLPF